MSREINDLIARHIMGYKENHHDSRIWLTGRGCMLREEFKPSEDITTAWQVVEKIELKMYEGSVQVIRSAAGNPDYAYECIINRQVYGKSGYAWQDEESKSFAANAPTAPMAICLCALKAKGVEVEENG